mgnify:CR=1 FL=1
MNIPERTLDLIDELANHGWTESTWAKAGGYQGKDERERIWFSPHCIKSHQTPGPLFDATN